VDCQFKAGMFGFTHSDYWSCDAFYKDIFIHFLNPAGRRGESDKRSDRNEEAIKIPQPVQEVMPVV
jgi:hypothetical protein